MGFFDKIKEGLRKTRENISGSIETMLNSFTKIDEELFEELEELLVMGDVGMPTAERICEELRVRVKQTGTTDPNDVMALLKEVVAEMISGDEELHMEGKPAAILVIGVNGVGKTTTIGKIASRLKSEGKSVVLGAADTFRAAAIDQLEVWSERAGVPLVKRPEGSDPASVVFDTIAKAKSIGADVMICDTAGRLHNKKNLMDELGKMSRIMDRELPDSSKEVLLVLDATTGQNAVNQAREFKAAAGITGIVLTKLDGTAKGGVVLAIREELQLPVKFVGVGEQLDDLQPFNARDFAEALFDNKAELDEEKAARIAEQNARYDEFGELVEDIEDEWAQWEKEKAEGQAAPVAAEQEEPVIVEEPEAPAAEIAPEPEVEAEPEPEAEIAAESEPEEKPKHRWSWGRREEPVVEEPEEPVAEPEPEVEEVPEPEVVEEESEPEVKLKHRWGWGRKEETVAEPDPEPAPEMQYDWDADFDDSEEGLTPEEEMAADSYGEDDGWHKETREERRARKEREKEEKRRLKEERRANKRSRE